MEKQVIFTLMLISLQACTYVDVEIGGDVTIDAPLPDIYMPPVVRPMPQIFQEGFYNTM